MDAALVDLAGVAGSPERGTPERAAGTRPVRWPGLVALGAGILTPPLVAVGITTAQADAYLPAWWLALAAVGTSLVAVLAGIGAVAGGWGRLTGALGILLGIAANPIVLVWALDLLEGL